MEVWNYELMILTYFYFEEINKKNIMPFTISGFDQLPI